MKLEINGEKRAFASELATVADLLAELGLDRIPVVVEHNKEALLPREHATTSLAEGDQLEIIRVVAGG